MPPPPPPRRAVLAVDGGGLHGLVPSVWLAGLERALRAVARERGLPPLPEPVCIGRYFDVIAGTSTGGIVAAFLALQSAGLLAAGERGGAAELVELYERRAADIFPSGSSALSPLWFLWELLRDQGKYSAEGLQRVLEGVLDPPGCTLSDLALCPDPRHRCSLLLWTYDLARRSPAGFYAYRAPPSVPARPDGSPAHRFGLITYEQLPEEEGPADDGETDGDGFVRVGEGGAGARVAPAAGSGRPPRWDPGLLQKLETNFGVSAAGLESRVRRSEASDFRVADCVLASSAAPTVLPPARVRAVGADKDTVFCDGGISADSPALEAFSLLRDSEAEADPGGRPLELGECAILSLGTTAVVDPLPAQAAAGLKSPLAWARCGDLVDTLVNANPEVVHGYLERFFASGGPAIRSRYLRVQVTADRRRLAAFAAGSEGAALARALADFDQSGEEEMRALRTMAELVGELYYPRFLQFVRDNIFPEEPERGTGRAKGGGTLK